MVKVTETALYITIPKTCPKQVIEELQCEIIDALKSQYIPDETNGFNTDRVENENYMLLALLKGLIETDRSDKIEIEYLDKNKGMKISKALKNLLELVFS